MLIIVGCGGHGRSIADVFMSGCREMPQSFCFVDSNAIAGEQILGQPVYRSLPPIGKDDCVILAIGDNWVRKRVFECYKNLPYVNLIARDAFVGMEVCMGEGNFLAHGVHVGPESILGNHNIINTHAVVEHECQIGDFCHIAPGSVIAGRTRIGNHVFLGAGVAVIDNVSIADNIIVGAGAVVTQDLTEPGVYVGVPARKAQKMIVEKEVK